MSIDFVELLPIGIPVLLALIFIPILIKILGPVFSARRILQTGLPSQAKILEMHDTHITINNSPQVRFVLEVKSLQGGPPYTAEAKMVISRFQPYLYQPGMTIAVKIDPAHPNKVAIDPTKPVGLDNNSVSQ